MKSNLSVEQLRELSSRIAKNPDSVNELTIEESLALRSYVAPYGRVIDEKKSYANISVINNRDVYFRRLHTTALIGYLFRTLDEYEPTIEIEKEIRKFNKISQGKQGEELNKLRVEHNNRLALIKSTTRGLIRQFLNRNFEYNPDLHIKGSHSANDSDPERKNKSEEIKRLCETKKTASRNDEKLSGKPEVLYKYLREHIMATYQFATDMQKNLKSVLDVMIDKNIDISDKQGILFKKYGELITRNKDLANIAKPICEAETLHAWKTDPPAELYHHFDRYLTNHYEQLRDVVTALYNEKEDVEYAIIYYDSFKTAEAARQYRVQHESEFRTSVLTVENSAVSLLGPFKENRQRVDFYNKNTEILKRMMEQMEADHKLGGDIMAKQVKAKKKKNIEEAGPDSPALASYSKMMNVASELGAKKILTKEEADKIADAKRAAQDIKEDYETPDDAIQVDILFPQQNADGTTTLQKSKFYTQAEAPVHLQEGGTADQYQPIRADTRLDRAYKVKKIVSRTGETKEILTPADDESDTTF